MGKMGNRPKSLYYREDGVFGIHRYQMWFLWPENTGTRMICSSLVICLIMKATKRNVEDTGKISISVWDDESGESYKLIGTGTYQTSGEAFDLADLPPKTNPHFK